MTCDASGIYIDCNEAAAAFLKSDRATVLAARSLAAVSSTANTVHAYERIMPALLAYGAVETLDWTFPALGVVCNVVARVHWDTEVDASSPSGRRKVPRYAHFMSTNIRYVDVNGIRI